VVVQGSTAYGAGIWEGPRQRAVGCVAYHCAA